MARIVGIYTSTVSLAKQFLLSDINYSEWANRRLLDGCSALSAGELERDQRISHTSILATLQHFYDGERVWLDCLSSTPDGGSWTLPTTPAPKLSIENLSSGWPQLGEGYRRWMEQISEASLSVELTIHLPGGIAPRFARWKILRHVLDHSTFHRGQVIGMIRSLGRTPPAINRMDYWLTEAA
jgi:uncharacterized damage-inducible protein DinB